MVVVVGRLVELVVVVGSSHSSSHQYVAVQAYVDVASLVVEIIVPVVVLVVVTNPGCSYGSSFITDLVIVVVRVFV